MTLSGSGRLQQSETLIVHLSALPRERTVYQRELLAVLESMYGEDLIEESWCNVECSIDVEVFSFSQKLKALLCSKCVDVVLCC